MTIRRAYAATSGSCVTSMIVMPFVFVQSREEPHDVLRALRVERAGRLVGEDEPGIVDERSRDRDSLLLAARHLVGMVARELRDADEFELLQRDRVCVRASGTPAYTIGSSTFSSALVRGSKL